MKKLITILSLFALFVGLFAQTSVPEKKLAKTLEKNKDENAVFECEMDLSRLAVSESGNVSIPLLSKSKVSIVSEMDMTDIRERISHSNRSTFSVTFEARSVKPNSYAVTKIGGIESVSEYKTRLAKEAQLAEEKRIAEEKRRAEEEKARWERERLSNLTKMPVQVVNQEVINLAGAESAWLPGQIQDKFKSNLQEFLGMKTVVDSKSEAALKKLQAESESAARDESTAIEFGKITTAKFALFTKIRKTGKGYTISADFTDLTTGEQMASATSKEYSEAEYLYGSTGAVDEITLSLGNKLGIKISDLNKNLLASGSASFSVDEQLALAKQNEENFKKMMAQYDADLQKLSVSNDISAIENKKKIEAEKALLAERQNAEKKRQAELSEQKKRAEADAKLEAERSIALKNQRDQMAKEAAAKAAEVRKLKMAKQGVLGQINIIESKKKALVEIRNSVESRSQELYAQLEKDRESEEERIRGKSYSTVELENGKPTEAALERREKQVIKSYKDLTNKFFLDADAVKKSTASQDAALLAEIRADQKALTALRTVSSMGDELKVSFGGYEGSVNGWRAYLSLYSDGVLLYNDSFIVDYATLSGKKAPNMKTELDDAVIEDYTNNVDMYSSLLTRGDPIVYFEIDYSVKSAADDKPSEYTFSFNKVRVINTVSGKTVQTSALEKTQPRTMKPEQDLREIVGVLAKERSRFEKWNVYFENASTLAEIKKANEAYLIWQNRLNELHKLGLNDTDISKIYDELPEYWIVSMPTEDLTDLVDLIQKNKDISESFVITDEITDYQLKRSVRHVLIPDSVTYIRERAFENCKSLESITIPNSVTSIGSSAFSDCTSLKSITIPNSVTSIGSYAFKNCESLEGITIPNSVTYIGMSAFEVCTSLKSITIPNSVTSIGSSAFLFCQSLCRINYTGTEKEWGKLLTKSNFYSLFNGTKDISTIKVTYNYKEK